MSDSPDSYSALYERRHSGGGALAALLPDGARRRSQSPNAAREINERAESERRLGLSPKRPIISSVVRRRSARSVPPEADRRAAASAVSDERPSPAEELRPRPADERLRTEVIAAAAVDREMSAVLRKSFCAQCGKVLSELVSPHITIGTETKLLRDKMLRSLFDNQHAAYVDSVAALRKVQSRAVHRAEEAERKLAQVELRLKLVEQQNEELQRRCASLEVYQRPSPPRRTPTPGPRSKTPGAGSSARSKTPGAASAPS